MLKTFTVNSHIPELFLSFSLLAQLVYNALVVNNPQNNFPVFNKENSRHTFIILWILAALYFGFIAHDYLSDTLYIGDKGSSISKFIVTLVAIFCLVLVQEALKFQKITFPEFYTIILLALLALLVMIDANDLMIFYLTMETQTLCFYVLASISRTNIFSVEAGLKYFVSGAFMSAFFLLGVSFLYGCLGTINLTDLSALLSFGLDDFSPNLKMLVVVGVVLVTATLLFKVAAAPFHFWMPDVYEGAPLAATLIFSVLPKYSLFFFFIKWINSLGELYSYISTPLLVFGVISTLVGTLYALKQLRAKRLLLYSSIAQVGFLVAGLAVNSAEGFSSVIFFLIIYIITSLLIWGHFIVIYRSQFELRNIEPKLLTPLYISNFSDIISYTGLWTLSFSIIFFSIGGIPPFAGFISKLVILDGLVSKGAILGAILLITISSVSVYYYIRILKIAFFEPVQSVANNNNFFEQTVSFNDNFRLIFIVFFLLLFLLIFLFFFPNYTMLICQYIVSESFKI
jgi:NADH-quinone oxidoreductase subunit N